MSGRKDSQSRPWQPLRRETIYQSPWLSLHKDDVRLPDGSVLHGYHVVDFPRPAVSVVAVREDGAVLMIEHYRFVTDSTSWELPAGRVDEGEDILAGAARELLEETGHRAERLERLGDYHPANGSTNLTFHVCVGRGVSKVGEVTDTNEVMRVAWKSPDDVWAMIRENRLRDGMTLTGLLWYFALAAGDR